MADELLQSRRRAVTADRVRGVARRVAPLCAAWTMLAGFPARPACSTALQSDVAFPPEVYAARRARLAEQVGDAAIIVPGAYLIGTEGHEKQDPTFWYLTGVESPYAILVIGVRPAGRAGTGARGRREVLFLPERYQFAGAQFPTTDERFRQAPWNQPIRRLSPGPEAARATGVGETYPLDSLARMLPELVGSGDTVFYNAAGVSLYAPPGLAPPLTSREQLRRSMAALVPGKHWVNVGPLVARMRLIKDAHEIAALRRAAQISAQSFQDVLGTLRPGMNELEVAGLMEYAWKRAGSPRAAFAPIVMSGPGAVSLFTLRAELYNSTNRVIRDGELVFIDYGAAEFNTYASDVCRTYPASGRFTAEQRRYYEIVLEAQEAALATIRPGVMMLDVVRAAAAVYRQHGLEPYEDIDRMGVDRVWGVMPSPTHYLARGGGLTAYSAQGSGVRDLGHHIGINATDSRDYSMPLAPGMVFTVEPKLYIPAQGIAIMIEDMILVTETGYENLSAGAPKTVQEIERAMAARRQ
ncbi:MAG TPA: Xaa-Pro peptidase family protein [Gemmatimonadales bacterium]|nr:Xaa-Pro peptidase family protein [Gemmatimonadales bacterium]